MQIENTVMLITGASSGIGAATARAAAASGARLVLAARREDRIRALAAEIGDAIAVRCDVTDTDGIDALIEGAVSRYGRIDVVVNNAGQGLVAPIEATDPADLRALFELNVVAPLGVMRAVIPLMRAQRSGTIVNVSSGTTFQPIPGVGAYSATKAALSTLSAVARVELAIDNITVSTMFPYITETDFMASLRGPAPTWDSGDSGDGPTPQTPESVAKAILRLIVSGDAAADLVPREDGGTLAA